MDTCFPELSKENISNKRTKDNNFLFEELHFMVWGLSFVTAHGTYLQQQHLQTSRTNNFKMHDPLHQQVS
jgi:hypothetical protein